MFQEEQQDRACMVTSMKLTILAQIAGESRTTCQVPSPNDLGDFYPLAGNRAPRQFPNSAKVAPDPHRTVGVFEGN